MTEQGEEINTNETDDKPFSIPGVIHWIEVAKRDKEIQSSKGPKASSKKPSTDGSSTVGQYCEQD